MKEFRNWIRLNAIVVFPLLGMIAGFVTLFFFRYTLSSAYRVETGIPAAYRLNRLTGAVDLLTGTSIRPTHEIVVNPGFPPPAKEEARPAPAAHYLNGVNAGRIEESAPSVRDEGTKDSKVISVEQAVEDLWKKGTVENPAASERIKAFEHGKDRPH